MYVMQWLRRSSIRYIWSWYLDDISLLWTAEEPRYNNLPNPPPSFPPLSHDFTPTPIDPNPHKLKQDDTLTYMESTYLVLLDIIEFSPLENLVEICG